MKSLDIRYIRVNQRDQSFFLGKATAYDLKGLVDFHFREPYSDLSRYQSEDFESLKRRLEENDVSFDDEPENGGVQRALNKARVFNIRDFVTNDDSALLPTTVLLAIDTSNCSEELPEMDEFGVFQLSGDMHISVIDGQHRLAGLFLASDEVLKAIEMPIVFMLDIDMPTAARLFQQINGKQKSVSKSVIFDLFDSVPVDEISNEDDLLTKQYHTICKNLYADPSSPLFRQIKMLGIGGGAISQSCFIETCKQELKFMNSWSVQDRYDVLYIYFELFQSVFPDDWPVPRNSEVLSFEELDDWANHVLKERKSQLLKTNGFVAIVKLLRYLNEHDLSLNTVEVLQDKIDWTHVEGTGAAAQKLLFEKLCEALDSYCSKRE